MSFIDFLDSTESKLNTGLQLFSLTRFFMGTNKPFAPEKITGFLPRNSSETGILKFFFSTSEKKLTLTFKVMLMAGPYEKLSGSSWIYVYSEEEDINLPELWNK